MRTAILAGVLLIVGGALAALVWSLSSLIERRVGRQVAEELQRSRQVLEDLQAYRQSLFSAEIRVVAEEPRLKAVAATEQITHETVLGVALELRRAIGSELFLITDGSGRLLADTADPTAAGFDLRDTPVVAGALATGAAEGVWTDTAGAYQVQGRRLAFGTTTVGVLVVGHRLDDRLAQTVRRQTGSAAFVLLDGKAIASSGLESGGMIDAAALAALPTGTIQPVVESGDTYLAESLPFPGYRGDRALRAVVLRSLGPARELQSALVQVVWIVGAAALLVALGFAFALSRRVARPVDALVALTRRVGAGDLAGRARPSSLVELHALGEAMNRMVAELERSRDELSQKERLEKELEIATRIQTSILPRRLHAAGLTVAAAMRPASEVGGDYYDFLPMSDGAWIGIGDVAGHGLSAGLVMLMVQSIVAALTQQGGATSPRDVVSRLNAVLFENIRDRLANDEHVTFTLLRYFRDGRVVFAGAHEDIVVWRKRLGVCETISTPGTWLGAVPDISRFTVDSELRLETGDVMLLYTDGITEAMDAGGQQLGLGRVCEALNGVAERPVEAIRDDLLGLVANWARTQVDDVTLLVLRYEA